MNEIILRAIVLNMIFFSFIKKLLYIELKHVDFG